MNIKSILFLLAYCISNAVVLGAGSGTIGPQVTTTDAQGRTVWSALVGTNMITYEVRDYGNLMPVLVYNCAYMASICNNVKVVLKTLPVAGSEKMYHFDRGNRATEFKRGRARRAIACPDEWAASKKPDQTWRCPEKDQPEWFGYARQSTLKQGPFKVQLADPEPSNLDHRNRLASIVTKVTVDSKGVVRISKLTTLLGALISCDEFPAASWIEGGIGANPYCAPISRGCPGAVPLQTDQNNQGFAHKFIGEWFKVLGKANGNTARFDSRRDLYTIVKFKFRTVDDISLPHASWVEANGIKRLCYGPGLSSAGNNPGCDPTLRPGEVPVNP